jgi:hypothetical protein
VQCTLIVLAALVGALVATGAAGAQSGTQRCRASTALGPNPHQLLFRAHCNFEVTDVYADPDAPATVVRVQRRTRLEHGDDEDHFRCRREDKGAHCSGTMGSEVTLVGSLRMRGNRCKTATLFGIQGGPECDSEDPHVVCPAIGYFAKLRDRRPSGCD